MNRKEYDKELEDIKKRIEKLEHVEVEEDEVWKPKHRENYWYIDSFGEVHVDRWLFFGGDEFRYSVGNVFKTKEEAEFKAERLEVLAELKKFSCKFRKGELNYYIFLDCNTNELEIFVSDVYISLNVYFESEDRAREAVKSVGEDRIKKYLFEVEE